MKNKNMTRKELIELLLKGLEDGGKMEDEVYLCHEPGAGDYYCKDGRNEYSCGKMEVVLYNY